MDWDFYCPVREIIDVLRCFNCNGYHHSAKNCELPISCPKCSENHTFELCKSENLRCINCVKSNEKLKKNLKTNHSAMDSSCPVYQRFANVRRNQTDYGGTIE